MLRNDLVEGERPHRGWPIKRFIDRIPGGMMIVPLLAGATIRTSFPHAFSSDDVVFKGSFTGGLLTGAIPLLAAFYVCLGATLEVRAAGYIVRKGAVLWAAKIATAAAVAFAIKAVAPDQNHLLLGLSALAIVAAFSDTNGGLYMALIGQLGRRSEDVAAYSIMSLESGPFFTMVILGVAGLASFPLLAFVFALLPLLVGMLLGNLDPDLRAFLGKGPPIIIPFFALALGAGIDLTKIVAAGIGGVVVGLAVVVLTGIVLVLADRITGGNGVAGVAAASTAGNAAAVPAAVAVIAANPGYREIAPAATVQVSAAVIVTALLVPIVTAWYARSVEGRAVTAAQARSGGATV